MTGLGSDKLLPTLAQFKRFDTILVEWWKVFRQFGGSANQTFSHEKCSIVMFGLTIEWMLL